jgi:hypothetical protein
MADDIFLNNTPRGYGRSAALQQQFDDAAATILKIDGWSDGTTPPRLVADLALEGGGAGTSAGAIAAVLVAALSRAGHPMTELRQLINSLNFMNFMPNGKLHQLLEEVGGKKGNELADLGS